MKLILLIDDDENVRLTFGRALRSGGYHVIEAESGTAGLELARSQMPDLILTDINMPGGDGQALLHHIRADPELSGRQVVLMTGRPDLVSPRRGMEQGADDFLVKPISREALLSCVEARLKRADVHWRVEDRVLSKLGSSVPSALPHEFFTPLAGIIGLTEILNGDDGSISAAELREFHRDIHQSALRLHRTLRNYLLILELRSPSQGGAPPLQSLATSTLKARLEGACETTSDRFGRHADVTLRWAPAPVVVTSDDLALIAEELLDNALKFSRPGTAVSIDLTAEGTLIVCDHGRGMTPKEMTEIGAFQQFDRNKNEQQGLGLGLVLVRHLAVRHGADFNIQSRPGGGIEVRIAFRLGAG